MTTDETIEQLGVVYSVIAALLESNPTTEDQRRLSKQLQAIRSAIDKLTAAQRF